MKAQITKKNKVLLGSEILIMSEHRGQERRFQVFGIDPYHSSAMLLLEKGTGKLTVVYMSSAQTEVHSLPQGTTRRGLQRAIRMVAAGEDFPRTLLEINSFFMEVKKYLQRTKRT